MNKTLNLFLKQYRCQNLEALLPMYLPSDVHVPAAVEGGGVASEHDAGHAHAEVAQTARTWQCRKIFVNVEK